MKLLSNIGDIPALKKENVYIKAEPELLEKINKIITDGHKNLQIVTDFDHTLTRHTLDDGKSVLTSFGMFKECPSIPQAYKDEEKKLVNKYKPIECCHLMSVEEKTKHMVDWYLAVNALLKGVKYPRNELTEIAANMGESFRKGVSDLLLWSQKQQVPVLVFSAGLGESVVAALRAANFLLPHVKVVSNFLAIDENDDVVGMKGNVIHTYNKNETAIKDTEYYELVKQRSNVLLMGDNIGDAGMADGMEHCDAVVKIGFLGRNVEGNLQNYLNHFDIVLVNEHSMDVANAIVQLLVC